MFDADAPFIFLPFATVEEVDDPQVLKFKWRGVPCTYNFTTRVLQAEGDDEAIESDPALHSWLWSFD